MTPGSARVPRRSTPVLRRNALTVALGAGILVLLFWNFWPRPASDPKLETENQKPSSATPNPAPESKIGLPSAATGQNPKSKIETSPREVSTLADALNSPATNIAADLRLVALVLETFRSNFPRTGNPVGLNSEITATLTGQNSLRLALIPPDHPAITREGELTDRWGSPFFFHAESATHMTITSAGPDKKLHTPDDESFAPDSSRQK